MYRGFVVLFSLLVGASCQNWNQPGCGRRPLVDSATDRIVAGQEAMEGDWPWQISLNNNGRHYCGASLINNQFLTSAAHCFSGPLTAHTIHLGVHDRLNHMSWVQIRRFKFHKNHELWNSALIRNDVALIQMDSPVVFNDYILPICMPTQAELADYHAGYNTWVTGWGSNRIGGPTTTKKMQGNHTILSVQRAQQRYGIRFDQNTQIAGGDLGDNAGPCQGDSGGPFTRLINDVYVLIGIVSWGMGCGDGGVYTRVDRFLDWLSTTMAQVPPV